MKIDQFLEGSGEGGFDRAGGVDTDSTAGRDFDRRLVPPAELFEILEPGIGDFIRPGFARAQALLAELRQPLQRRWQCVCGELVEGGFEQCWRCGAMMTPD